MASWQTRMAVLGQALFAILAALTLAACNSSTSRSIPGADAGITVIPPLTGHAASNELQFVERIRHLPKSAAFERRTFASASSPKEPLKYLLFKPKGFQ